MKAITTFALIAASAAAWWLLGPSPLLARSWAVLLSVVLPVVAGAQTRWIGSTETIPRIPVYISSMLSLWILALVTIPVVYLSGVSRADLGLVVPGALFFAGAAVSVTAVSIGILILMSAAGARESPLARRLIPVVRQEKIVFAALSVTAGICEEFVFRGFLLHTFSAVWGGLIAVVLSSIVFGALHAYQQLGGAVRAALLGALLCMPPLLAGTILPSIVAHAAIDLVSGLFLARRLVPEMA
jgi:CAAX protease family protein